MWPEGLSIKDIRSHGGPDKEGGVLQMRASESLFEKNSRFFENNSVSARTNGRVVGVEAVRACCKLGGKRGINFL